MNKFLLFLSVSLLVSCNGKQNNSPTIYFAGEIVNPKNDSVVLFKDQHRICSTKLDSDNRFEFKLDESAEEGLYHFEHMELQYIYLEKGDSILIRVNTRDFDESLVFEGKGQEINNFLLEMYLVHEHEERGIVKNYYKLEPKAFIKKIDSLNALKQQLLHTLTSESSLTESAINIANACIDYTSYLYKENYPRRHFRSSRNKEKLTALPEDFYDFRKDITYKNPQYTYLLPYYNYMVDHFKSMSYINCENGCEVDGDYFKNQLHFNEHQLLLIDSLVGNKELKDNLERHVALQYLLSSNDSENNQEEFISKFNMTAKDNKHIDEVKAVYNNISSVRKNKPVPSVTVFDFKGKEISLLNLSKKNKKVVYYFWMGERSLHFKNMMKRVATLENKHPEYTFIGINLKTDVDEWKQIITNNKLDENLQFRTMNFSELKNILLINRMNKALITDNGLIVEAFGDMYASF